MKSLRLLGILPDLRARRRDAKKRARRDVVNPIFELRPLERRLLLAVHPTITIPSPVMEGQHVFATLDPHEDSGFGIDHWVIDWGDLSDATWGSGNGGQIEHVYNKIGHFTIHANVVEADKVISVPDDPGEAGSGSGEDPPTYHNETILGGSGEDSTSIDVTPYIHGPFQVAAGGDYELQLHNVDPFGPVDSWLVNWNDGSAPQTFTDNRASVHHTFNVPSDTYLVTATAIQGGDSFVSNTLPVVVRLGAVSAPPSTNLQINFQPGYSSSSTDIHFLNGTLADIGHVFTDQANFSGNLQDFAYGWDSNVIDSKYVADTVDATDPGFESDTYTPMQAGGVNRTWTIGLAPGTYSVRIVAGASDFGAGTHNSINANGTSVIDFTPTSEQWHDDQTKTIVVDDTGRLELTNGLDASNNVINFVQITPSAHAATTPAAPSGLSVAAEAQNGSLVPVNLNWVDNSDNETGFKIYRSTSSGSGFSLMTTTGPEASSWSDSVTPNTTYYYKVSATNSNATTTDSTATSTVSIYTGGLNVSEAPYGGSRWAIPGRVEIENFDIGSGGSTDSDAKNVGDSYRNSAIDISPAGSSEGGNMVGWTQSGETMSYSVHVATAATYRVDVAVASAGLGGSFHLKLDTTTVGATLHIPDTGGWTSFQTVSLEDLSLPVGDHVLTLVLDGNGPGGATGNFDYLQFTAMSAAAPAAPQNLYAVPSGAAQVKLSWTNTSAHASGFVVQRSSDGQTYTTVATIGFVTTYVDVSAAANTAYAYRVLARNSKGNSAPSNIAQISTSGASDTALPAKYDGYTDTTWYGTSAQLHVQQGGPTAYFQFDTTNVTGSIQGATLWLYGYENAQMQPGVLAKLSGLTDNSWSDASGPPTGTSSGIATDTLNLSTGRWFAFDVTSFLASSGPIISLSLSSLTGTNQPWLFDAHENAPGSSFAPQPILVINRTTPPAAPTLNAITVVSTSQLNLSWSFNGAADGVYIERSTDNSLFTQIATVASSSTTYSNTGLTGGRVYYYRIRAYGDGFGESSYSATQSAATTTAAPTSLSASAASSPEIDLAWANGNNYQFGIRISRSTDGTNFSQIADLLGLPTSFADTTVSASSTYYYKLVAYGAGPDSAAVTSSAVTTPAAAPSAPTAFAIAQDSSFPDTKIDLSWTNPSNATSVTIERSSDGTTFVQVAIVPTSSTPTYINTGLTPYATYYYRIRATGPGGDSAYVNSDPASITTAMTAAHVPTSLTATRRSPSEIVLTWANGTVYQDYVYVERSTDGSTWTQIASLGGTIRAYVDTGLTAGQTYHYRVRAHNQAGYTAYTDPVTAGTGLVPPLNVVANAVSSTEVDLTWADGGGGHDGVKIQRSTNNTSFTDLTTITGTTTTTYHDTSVSAGSTYYYRLYAYSTGEGINSAYTSPVMVRLIAPAPTDLTAALVTGAPDSQVSLAWAYGSGSSNAFRIERSTDNVTFTILATTASNTYQDKSVAADTVYYYRVIAEAPGGDSSPSSVASVTTAPSMPFDLAVIAMSTTLVDVSWINITASQEGVKVQRATSSGGSYTVVATLDGALSTFADATVSANTSYYYRVYSYGAGGNSLVDGPVLVVTPASDMAAPGQPTAFTVAEASSSQIDLSWMNGSGTLSGVYVERSLDNNNDFVRVANYPGSQITFQDTGLAPGTTYYYRIRDYGPGGVSTASSVQSAVTGSSVGSTSSSTSGIRVAGVTDTVVMLAWNPPPSLSGVASYRVERGGSTLAVTSLPIFFDAGVDPGTSYDYTVTALDSDGNDLSFSVSITALTLGSPAFDSVAPGIPGTPTATSVTTSSLILHWTASTDSGGGLVTYEILRDGESIGATTSTTFADSGLDYGTTYVYSVRAIDLSDNASAAASAPIAVNGADGASPGAPRELTVTSYTGTSVTLSWLKPSDDTGVTGYKVYKAWGTSNVLLTSSPISGTTYTDSTIASGTTYIYTVYACDAAGNQSPASVSVAPQDQTNLANGQYIPPAWIDDFYDNFTKVLRQRIDQTPAHLTDPIAARWLNSQTKIFVNGQVTTLKGADNVYFHDRNGNGIYDANEPMWESAKGGGYYVQGEDRILAGAPVDGMPGMLGVSYIDFDGDGTWSPGELIYSDTRQIEGEPGQVDYHDTNGNGVWDPDTEPVWLDSNDDHIFNEGEPVLSLSPKDGDWGKTNGLNSVTIAGHTVGFADIADRSFQDDVADAYVALDGLATHYANPNRFSSKFHDLWSVGDILALHGSDAGSGTISVDRGGTTVTGDSDTDFKDDYVEGDYIQIGGLCYPVEGVSEDGHTLSLAAAFDQADTSGSGYGWVNWTLVPHIPSSELYPGITFTRQRGIPVTGNAVFPQQFDELYFVLNQLNTLPNRYDEQFYASASTTDFLNAADEVMGIYTSAFGAAKAATDGNYQYLKDLIAWGDIDPGSVRSYGDIAALQELTGELEGLLVRDGQTGQFSEDETVGTFLDELLPKIAAPGVFSDDDIHVRCKGHWSASDYGGVDLGDGGQTDSEHLAEILRVADAAIGKFANGANPGPYNPGSGGNGGAGGGIWIDVGTVAPVVYPNNLVDGPSRGYYWNLTWPNYYLNSGQTPPPDGGYETDPLSNWSTSVVGGNGGFPAQFAFGVPVLSLGDVAESIYWTSDSQLWDVGRMAVIASTITQTLTIPSNHNPEGGADLTTLVPGSVDGITFSWGEVITRSYDPTTVAEALEGAWDSLIGGPSSSLSLSSGGFLFRGLKEDASDDPSRPPDVSPNYSDAGVEIAAKTLPSAHIYGLAPYTPADNQPVNSTSPYAPPPTLGDPPSDGDDDGDPPDPANPNADEPIPLTSEMDYLNVVPDSNLDGIVQVDHDQSSFGPDTGSMSFAFRQQMAQVYIPLNTDGQDNTDSSGNASASNLPIHAYLQQGAFGEEATSIGSLRDTDFTYADASQDGQSFGYSLDTHVRTSVLIDDAKTDNHFKQVEVIRPGGNSVVFDFDWDEDSGLFSAIGTPVDWGSRSDSRNLYVLRDLTPQDSKDLAYDLEFASGIVHHFGGSDGMLQSVSDASGLSANADSAGAPVGDSDDALPWDDTSNSVAQVKSPRYLIDITLQNGTINEVDYATRGSGTSKIKTMIHRASNGSIDSLTKKDAANSDAAIAPFSYGLSGSTITHAGLTLNRSVDTDSGAITLKTTRLDNGSWQKETSVFNDDGLITSDTITLSDDGSTDNATSAQTTYEYNAPAPSDPLASDPDRYVNGAPDWGKVTDITYPDSSWEHFVYDDNTGWVIDDYAPYKNTAKTSLSTSQDQHFGYDASVSDNGDVADPMLLTERPRETVSSIAGTTTGISYARYVGDTIETRLAPSASANWAASVLGTDTTITGFDSYTQSGPGGTVIHTGNALEDLTMQYVGGNLVAADNSYFNTFGGLGNPKIKGTDRSTGVGEEPDTIIPGNTDAFGRPYSQIENGIVTYYGDYTWFGPETIIAADDSQTLYTFTDDGRIQTKQDPDGVVSTYSYDAMGNVTHIHVAHGSLSTDTYVTFDAQGRQTSSTDELENVTSYDYESTSTGTTETTSFQASGAEDPTTIETVVADLDGTEISDSGASVADPSIDDEGIVTSSLTIDGVPVPVGSTWTKTSTNQSGSTWQDYTIAYYNLLGQEVATQSTSFSTGAATTDSACVYDCNGRVTEEIGEDGSLTHYDYDPMTGELADTWVDNDADGSFEGKTDSRQRQTLTPLTTNDATFSGTTQILDVTNGQQPTFWGSMNGGLDTEQIVNGQKTTTHTSIGAGAHDTTTTTNPDGTSTVDSYTDGLLVEEDSYKGTDLIGKTTYEYDGLARNNYVHQFQQDPANPSAGLSVELTTQYKYRPDDSVKEIDYPDGTSTVVGDTHFDPLTGIPTQITTSDGTMTQGVNAKGQITSQVGGGVIPASYEYNSTGALSAVHLYNSTSITTATPQETIGYGYDPVSGLLTGKGYGDDGPAFHYGYNSKDQLTSTIVTGAGNESSAVSSSFTYDSGGRVTQRQIDDNSTDQTGSGRFNDQFTYDNQGRVIGASETFGDQSGNVSAAVADAYTYDPTTGALASEAQGEGVTANYHYYGPQDGQAGQEPGALKDMSFDQNGTGVGSQSYTYDSAGRVQTMTLSGLETFTYNYIPGTNLIQSETVKNLLTGDNVLYTGYGYDSNNRLESIDSNGTSGGTTTSGGTSIYDATYTYQTDGLRASESVDQHTLGGSTLSHAWDFGYDDQQQLTSVTNSSDSSAAYSYAYDKLGNQISSALGSVNGFNEYANISYNDRGDVTDDGSFSYSWDAKDRLIGVISDASNTTTKESFSYDANDRLSAVDTWTLDSNSNWVHAAPSYRMIYDNQGRIVEVAQSDNSVYTQFAWGPDGKLAGVIRHSGSNVMTFAAVADANGNVTELKLISSGQIFSARVDPYGNVISTDNAITSLFISPFAYGGLMRDNYSGVNFGLYSVQDPRIDQWLRNDPTAENGGLNTREFCKNNPINFTDQRGTSPVFSSDPVTNQRRQIAAGYQKQLIASQQGSAPVPEVSAAVLDQDRVDQANLNAIAQAKEAQWRAQSEAMQQAVRAEGYNDSVKMAGIGSYIGQGVANDLQGLQNFIVGVANAALHGSAVGPALNAMGVSIHSHDWSDGLIATEYGGDNNGHGLNVGVAEAGWSLVTPAFLGKVLSELTTEVAAAEETAGVEIEAGRPGVVPGEVDTHSNLSARQRPFDGLELDHQPSHASNVVRREQELGRRLTAKEEAEVFSQGTAVAVPNDVHAAGPTFRALNTSELQMQDALDPIGAAERDSEAMVANTARLRPDLLKQMQQAAIEIVQRVKDGFGL